MNKNISDLLKFDISKASNLKNAINIIAKYAKDITETERCSLFIFNKKKDQLISIYNDGIEGRIVLNSNVGIVGYAFHKKQTILENDTSTSSIFSQAVDKKTTYKTISLLTVPIIDEENKRLGVIQLLNKKQELFNSEDKENIEEFAKILATLLNNSLKKNKTKQQTTDSKENKVELLQEKLDNYLLDKKLFIMNDGSAYYKIVGMIRDYFIGADKCYQLNETPTKIKIYHYNTTKENDFLSIDMLVHTNKEAESLFVSERGNKEQFKQYYLEED